MKKLVKGTVLALACLALANNADAADIAVSSDITTSTVWTANNVYNLDGQIYVRNGATLTIEAGTLIANTTGAGGSLAITRGSQIFVQGTAAEPVIMTSTADTATWTAGDPTTGVWREAANEWGNLTIMGNAYIGSCEPGNSSTCNANNVSSMEGLTNGPSTDLYGGGDDNDDSGSINYLSIRYGGRVVALANELNGLSLGGIGRGTDINFIEIMNNVDDGIEIWGGTVNLKNFSIFNVGDDSLDIDQGWRGKAQFGLIVQGHSLNAGQGSGVGDNAIEHDGAETSDYQPVTTAAIYNMTVVGQPVDGDGLTAWRDNARIQYGNCIFMDCGDDVIRFDNVDGDPCGTGYGFNGTLSWADTWSTDNNAVPATPNDCGPGFYTAQSAGKLAQIRDSVFFRNLKPSAYDEANTVGVFDAANDNVLTPGFDDVDSPIQALTRGPLVTKGGKALLPVISINPLAANAATTSVGTAPNDGFFTAANYRGAFDGSNNWLTGWSAADAFGFLADPTGPETYCVPKLSSAGCTNAITTSSPSTNPVSGADDYDVIANNVQGIKNGLLFGTTFGRATIPFSGGTLCVQPPTKRGPIAFSAGTSPFACDGQFVTPVNTGMVLPAGLDAGSGNTGFYQYWYRDPQNGAGSLGTALSNGIEIDFQ